jgi:glycosyltransferase involved in cell wall biosynthesis
MTMDIQDDNSAPESPATAWPRVTLGLLTYNQERWVRAAIEGALAQDYPNLEIIVSDDCSVDRTFDLMQEIARSYTGPHTLVVRQTRKNCGSLLHVQDIAKAAGGELLVLAAGDDVSKPNRVTVLQQAWRDTGAWGLCSRFDRIDEDGLLLAEGERAAVLDARAFDRYFTPDSGPVPVVHGCTSAYDARLFDYLQLASDDYVLSEDGALSVLLNLIGKSIVQLDDSLVLYRQNAMSLTNNIGNKALRYAEVARDERNIERFAFSQANRCRLFLRMNGYLGAARARELSVPGVETELRRQETKLGWFRMPLAVKASTLLAGNIPVNWALPRLLGRAPFYLLKSIASHAR